MKVPVRIAILVIVVCAFYTYVGNSVPQAEQHPPKAVGNTASDRLPPLGEGENLSAHASPRRAISSTSSAVIWSDRALNRWARLVCYQSFSEELLPPELRSANPLGLLRLVNGQWTKDGVDIPGATGSTLDLSVAGNGDRGNVIRVRATPNDGTVNGTAATSSPLTIGDSAPSGTVALNDHAPDTNAVLTATAPVTFS